MQILAIGNSFSHDATRYLHQIARADGEDLQVTNLYIGGCSLERHFRNMRSGQRVYELQCNGHQTGFSVSLEEALLSRQWDVITLQQASHESFQKESYSPYAELLTDYIRQNAPKAKLLIHQTWAYEQGSDRLKDVAGYDSAHQMFADIESAYAEIAKTIHADGIIPSGAMLQDLLSLGIEKVHRDGFHARLGMGRYALALLWYRMLTGRTVAENTFRDFDEPVSPEEISIVKAYVDGVCPL